ncbi:BMP family ABC transporter substrate-binding protein [Alphaproteobacteria bacterium]|uniref:BMP family ABC transporter substrate-binding protein n=1 Tax=Candidatus Ponderosibacter sp. Uisw_141_02 TaxID=3231000 RepID=UPI002311F2F4|nr:BMP family ABC transporter substrate-binding protein [Alphaproteobacteria bacterium]MDA9251595.1 BMP family ABC transporter substrate-binding protein [Alphaproteobacteria bacterium]MDB3896778.1 BMP family ABC transporter substrate-binding protein [Alphaproteobacteria bacterium]MDC1001281.1 BMP family ABC transporter substrate-binding protein [Alphaproteobacteria bacterium]MDG2489117.1 BMP family ABC transporter substrate-binding protein [Alphaproteobacteria bacterium]
MKTKNTLSFGAVVAVASLALSALVGLTTVTTANAADKVKVGFVYLTTPGDHGWTYAHEVARQDVEKHFGDKVVTTFVENVPEGPDSARVIRELAKQGNEIIFTTSFGYMDHTIKVAKEFPNVKFEHITGYKRSPNVATGNIRFYEGRYVQGVVAGLMTKSNKIGYLASFPIPEVIQGINAFGIGLRSVNPKAEVSVIWVNSWYDPVKEADAAKVHIAEGADILAQHTDSPAMLQTAQKAGVHGFGQSSDMKAFAPKAQLFSSVNNWGPYYISKIQQMMDGKWSTGEGPDHWAGNTWVGMADDYLVLSPFENMPSDVAAAAAKAAADIKSGKNKIFTGPIKDNSGKIRVPAGKTLNDGELFQTLDYYVDGISGKIPG